MNQYIIETILGLAAGLFLGITGIAPTGLVLLILDYFNIGNYITNLGTVLFLNLFPITIGSVWEFYKSDKINYNMGFILLFKARPVKGGGGKGAAPVARCREVFFACGPSGLAGRGHDHVAGSGAAAARLCRLPRRGHCLCLREEGHPRGAIKVAAPQLQVVAWGVRACVCVVRCVVA